MPRIVVLDGYTLNPGDNPWTPVEGLGELIVHDRTAPDAIVARCAGAPIVLTNKTPIDAATMAALPALRYIGVLATGHNIVDSAAAAARGIPVCNVPEYSTDSVAQFVVALILNHCHAVARHSVDVHAGGWSRANDFCYTLTPQIELRGKVMGVLGFGRIAARVAELAHALGMQVIAWNRSGAKPASVPVEFAAMEAVVARADFLSVHVPQTPDNAGFINRTLIQTMKPTAMLINTARGGLVVEDDLAACLRQGVIAAAAIDVLAKEPMRGDSPYLGCPNLTITPHIAWTTLEARRRLMQVTADNIAAFVAGAPINVVNAPVAGA